MDAEKAAQYFQSYLSNAEKSSGKTIAELHAALKKSGAVGVTGQREYLKATFGLGHGHAQAVVMKYINPDFRGTASDPKPATKIAAKAAKKAAPKKAPARKK